MWSPHLIKGVLMEQEEQKRVRRTKAEMEQARAQTQAILEQPTDQTTSKFKAIQEKGYVEFWSHAYKLVVASFKKHFLPDNIAPTPSDWQNMQHEHIFHTKTSDGKNQIHSNPVGGHFHVLNVETGPDGTVPVVTCISGPKKYVMTKNAYNQKVKTIVDFLPGIDTHTHEIEFKHSSKVKPRTVNAEAVKVVSYDANKLAPIPGVEG